MTPGAPPSSPGAAGLLRCPLPPAPHRKAPSQGHCCRTQSLLHNDDPSPKCFAGRIHFSCNTLLFRQHLPDVHLSLKPPISTQRRPRVPWRESRCPPSRCCLGARTPCTVTCPRPWGAFSRHCLVSHNGPVKSALFSPSQFTLREGSEAQRAWSADHDPLDPPHYVSSQQECRHACKPVAS